MTRIVGLCGRPGAGKDTASRCMAEAGWRKFGFIDKLKDALADIFGFERADLDDFRFKETPHPRLYGKTPRKVLQDLGTEGFRRMVGNNVWIDTVKRTIDGNPDSKGWYITDLRYMEEGQAIKFWGGELVAICRDSMIPNPDVLAHASEQDYPKLLKMSDYILENDSTVDEIVRRLACVLGIHVSHNIHATLPGTKGEIQV